MTLSSDTPALEDVILAACTRAQSQMFSGWLPGQIQSYDTTSRTATVQIMIQDVEYDASGTRQVVSFPIVNGVPIGFPGQAGAFIRWTVAPGDNVVIMFACRSTDLFMVDGRMTDPQDVRMHDINDAFAIPVAAYDRAHVADASAQIEFTGSEIRAGGTAVLALKQDLADLKSALATYMLALNSAPAGVGAVASAAKTAFDSTLAAWPVGTSKLKGG